MFGGTLPKESEVNMATLPICPVCWCEVVDDAVGDRYICPRCFRQFRIIIIERLCYSEIMLMLEGVFGEV